MGCVVSELVEYGRVGVVISGLVAIADVSEYGRVGLVGTGSAKYGRAGFVGTGLAETVDGSAKPAPTEDV
jgi:hypothetical protein